MTIQKVLADAASRLERAEVAESRLQAEYLLADLLDCDRGGLLVRRREELEPAVAELYEARLCRRVRREPLQHITGVQEFYGLRFEVNERVLVPRPESEGLVDAVLALDPPRRARVADLGTGSGCLAVALAVAKRDFRLHALDSSRAALEVARSNARRHGVAERIQFIEGNMASPPAAWRGIMDVVLSNPPYVSEAEWHHLEPEVRDHDPRQALVAGPSGLEAYRSLMPAAVALLRPGGRLLLELGYGQAEAVSGMARQHGLQVRQIKQDFQGIPRVLLAAIGQESCR
jgi:release factor glutamine methyltransferase